MPTTPTPDPYQTALDEFGAIGVFAKNNPEINAKLQLAIKEQWDAARFERELWTTQWYKSLSDNQRQIEVLHQTDPGTYNAKVHDATNNIYTQALGMGKQLTWQQAQDIALKQMWNNWDSGTLTAHIATDLGNATTNGVYKGQAGDVQNHVRSTLLAYGIPINDAGVTEAVNDILAGHNTTGGFDNQVIGQASKLFPMYADDFKEGRSLSDIAKPYIQQAATTLEIDPSAITMQDKNVLKALQGDGKAPMPLWQFNEQLKADPRWQHTDNAKNSAYDTLKQIGSDWGFA